MKSVLVYEPNIIGHYPFFLELICKACHAAEYRVFVATPMESPARLPDTAVRVFIEEGEESFRKATRLARHLQVDALFICSFDTLLYTEDAHAVVDENQFLDLAIYGFWIKPYAVIRPTLLSRLSRGYRRANNVFKNLKKLKDCGALKNVFVLDEELSAISSPKLPFPVDFVPDPWRPFILHTREEARKKLDLPQNKTILCHLGDDTRRKGLLDVLRCLDNIKTSSLMLVRGGRLNRRTLEQATLLERLQNKEQFVYFNQWISEEQFDLIMQASDYVLIPYHSHMGSSGILSRAIGHRRMVIASDYGLIGKRVKTYNLGYLYQNRRLSELGHLLCRLTDQKLGVPEFDQACEAFSSLQTISGIAKKIRAHQSGEELYAVRCE